MFVYVVGSSVDGPIKIGITEAPKNRLKHFQNGSHEKVWMFHTLETETELAPIIEAYAHRILSSKKVRGEWFKTSANSAFDALNLAAFLVKVGIHRVKISRRAMNRAKARIETAPMTIKDCPASVRRIVMAQAAASKTTCGDWLGTAIAEHAEASAP